MPINIVRSSYLSLLIRNTENAEAISRGGEHHPEAMRVALNLIELGEQAGVRNGVAVDALLDDLTIHTASARLWPQTERLKAASLAAVLTGDNLHWTRAVAAATTLLQYLATPTRGLWRYKLNADGTFLASPAPASNFYHIVAAILAFTMALRRCSGPPD